MFKKTILMLMFSLVLFFTSACGSSGKQTSTNTETPVATPVETKEPEETDAPSSEDGFFNKDFIVPDSKIRPVAVMIDNQGDKVLPQGGISQAQIVYEILVEHDITRYMAVFWNTMPEMIGPVRSSRHYFLDYSMEYDAIYTHIGWSDYAKADIKKLKIQNINGLVRGNPFWDLNKNKGDWQDSFTSGDRIEKEITALKYPTEPKKGFPFKYSDQLTMLESGEKAVDISIRFASKGGACGYKYLPELNVYERLRMEKPHMERNSGEQVKTANIIVQQIASPLIPGDSYGRRNLNDIGTGKGYFVTAGRVVDIEWSKKARDSQTTYATTNGKPLLLNRGQTWIEIVPDLKYVNIQ